MREFEEQGVIGELTSNTIMLQLVMELQLQMQRNMHAKYAKELVADGVDAVILTSTWGTCTRCGATMVKEIERAGIPVVHMCTVVPISLTVGANRIVPTIAIPHPLGNPALPLEEEQKIRRNLVIKKHLKLYKLK